MLVLLEKSAPAVSRDYKLLAALRLSTLHQELREAASQGFRLVPRGLFSGSLRGDEEIVLLLERTPGSVQRYEYLLAQGASATHTERLSRSSAREFGMSSFPQAPTGCTVSAE